MKLWQRGYAPAVITIWARSRIALVGCCAVFGALSVALGGAVAARATPVAHGLVAPRGAQGGYVVIPTRLRSARLQARVPALRCLHSADRSVRVGIFGHTRYRTVRTPWFAAITSACHAGKARYVADFGDYTGTEPTPVHAGDLIRIVVDGGSAPSFEIDDLTTGEGMGGGSFGPPGQVTVPTVVLGATRTGSAAHVGVAITHCAVNGKALSGFRHHRQRQVVGRTVAVSASALTGRGTAFGLTIR